MDKLLEDPQQFDLLIKAAEEQKQLLEDEKKKRQAEEQDTRREQILKSTELQELAFLHRLHGLGPRTKFQLLSMGLKSFMIANLVRYGILEREYNAATNLTYYRVKDDVIREYADRVSTAAG